MKHPHMDPNGLSRRSFVAGGLHLTALGSLSPLLGAEAFASGASRKATERDERILVVVQLSGGNDGLNTVIPFSQDAYYKMRPTLGQKPNDVHLLDDHIALHPELGGLAGLYKEGALSIVHGVGHPNADRSHFRSLEIWHTAEPFKAVGRVGWLGNLADQMIAKEPGSLPALSVGGRSSALSMRGATAVPPTIPDDRGFRLARTSQQFARERALIASDNRTAAGGANLAFLRSAARTSYDAAERMSKIAKNRPSEVPYPDKPLAKELQLVAQMIRGRFGTRIFHVSLGGFDTHASQAYNHNALLSHLNSSLTAFQTDLAKSGHAERVVTMVFSEFGRRAKENGSRGTDHGRGNPVLLLGPSVKAGQHGTRPDLESLIEGDIPSTTDFRGIYAQLERDWMGLEPFSKAKVEAPDII